MSMRKVGTNAENNVHRVVVSDLDENQVKKAEPKKDKKDED